jgi:hypothetical protein
MRAPHPTAKVAEMDKAIVARRGAAFSALAP